MPINSQVNCFLISMSVEILRPWGQVLLPCGPPEIGRECGSCIGCRGSLLRAHPGRRRGGMSSLQGEAQ